MNIQEQMVKFFEQEYKETVDLLERKPNWMGSRKEVIFNSLQRCLGVAQFVQTIGVPYSEVDIYDKYREKFYELLKEK